MSNDKKIGEIPVTGMSDHLDAFNNSKDKEIPMAATPESLAAQAVVEGDRGNVRLMWFRGVGAATVTIEAKQYPNATAIATIREWLVEQIEGAYKAGEKAGKAEGQEYLAGRVGAARGDALTEHANALRAALGVTHTWEECLAIVCDLVARDKATPREETWPIKSWSIGGTNEVTLCVPERMASLVMKLGVNRQGLRVVVEGIPAVPDATLSHAAKCSPSFDRDHAVRLLDGAVTDGVITAWTPLGKAEAFICIEGQGSDVPVPLRLAHEILTLIRRARKSERRRLHEMAFGDSKPTCEKDSGPNITGLTTLASLAQTLGLSQDGGASEIRERIVGHVNATSERARTEGHEEGRKAGYEQARQNLARYIARYKAAMAKDEEKAREVREDLAALTARIDTSAREIIALNEATHVLANEAPR